MRIVGTLDHENHAERMLLYLKKMGVDGKCEVFFDTDTGTMQYQIWVFEEDQIVRSRRLFEEFMEHPSDAKFNPPSAEADLKEPSSSLSQWAFLKKIPVTLCFLFCCIFLFLWNAVSQQTGDKQSVLGKQARLTQLQLDLFYDVPSGLDEIPKWAEKNQIRTQKDLETMTPQQKKELREMRYRPYWNGIYPSLLEQIKNQSGPQEGAPLFFKIKQGEIWRFFSPCLLHTQFFHILFNMIWLWALSRPIELRIGSLKTLLLTVVSGVVSNTAQYLMTGPFFLGYSGVIMGLAGFIWMRQKIAPWEGYGIQRVTFLFLFLFIGGSVLLSCFSFLIQLVSAYSDFSPNIANTAHLAGGFVGLLIGRCKAFSFKVVAK